MTSSLSPVLLFDFLGALPPVVVAILAIVVIIFIIKSLIKFAIIAGAIGLIVFVAWQMDFLSF